jgi:signal transduction histidine kinase
MIIFLLLAVFRYRIWDIEFFIRRALLYLGATLVITFSYLLLIWAVDRMITRETNLIRFLAVAVSVILFLILRDRIQRVIDRIFHRETYDSATVVSDFEGKLAGIYRFEELKEKIVQGLDEIFHFKSFVFNLKKNKLTYEPAFVFGINEQKMGSDFEVTTEFEEKLRNSKVFSPEELSKKSPAIEISNGELIVPMISDHQPAGFFICGQKKSERIYSRQDINVLILLARRILALLHTANLYQKDLDRQLLLERERARISQDMHDDIGAGLTKIAMISEAPVEMQDAKCEMQDTNDCRLPTANLMQDRLNRIASSSREMISRLNVIVWALNPKYDNLESLVAYLRRYFGEYLDNFGIQFKTDFADQIPELSITPDTRRNIFYAVQEAIHNAVKHSSCSEIGLVVRISPQLMEITIADNGKGFEKAKHGSGGNGLLNMQRRAEKPGGSFEIQSVPGKGTRVLFSFML